MQKIVWIGNRLSDIEECKKIFSGSINLYGDENEMHKCFHKYRANNNIPNPDIDNYIERELEEQIKNNEHIQFMFYNQKKSYMFNDSIRSRTICLNDLFLLELLNDKITCHNLLSKTVNFAPYITLFGEDINYANLRKIFPNYSQYVVQCAKSSGGFGTYLLNEKNNSEIKKLIEKKQCYLVSAYVQKNISFNLHLMIGENDYIVFPPSKQLIQENNYRLSYRGADFINIQEIDKNQMQETVFSLVESLKNYGYKGIVGADFIQDITTGEIYLVELNCRFQGSSFLLNTALKKSNICSLQEMNIAAFNGENISHLVPNDFKVNMAATFYYEGEDSKLTIENANFLKREYDGLSTYPSVSDFAYLYKDLYEC